MNTRRIATATLRHNGINASGFLVLPQAGHFSGILPQTVI